MVSFGNSHRVDEVPDPYYSGSDGFEYVLDILEDSVNGLINKVEMDIRRENKVRIEEKLGSKIKSFNSLSGGCISDAFKVTTVDGLNYFLKYNPSISNDMFFKEANGLRELSKANAIRIPDVFKF